MPKEVESCHAPKLRELGFAVIDKEISLAVRSILPRRLSRNERRRLRNMRYHPWFTMTNLMTLATDDTGQSWVGPSNIDLSNLGFDNKTEQHDKHMKDLHHSDPKYH
jgi:hypothetical protein